VDDPTSFDLTATVARDKAVQLSMHDHGRSVGTRSPGETRRGERHQRVGPSGVHGPVMIFTRHFGQALGETVQCSSKQRTLGRGEFRLQAEALAVVEVPPRQGAIPVDFLSFSMDARAATSPLRRMHPEETSWAHEMSLPSVWGVANRVSSTTLSMLRSPQANASDMRGSLSRTCDAAIQRSAFQ